MYLLGLFIAKVPVFMLLVLLIKYFNQLLYTYLDILVVKSSVLIAFSTKT